MNSPRKKRRNLGFTLVEMLLVMTIIGLLAAVVVVQFGNIGERARINATRASISSINTAVQTFEIMAGSYPKSLEELTAPVGDNPGLLKKEALVDAWGQPFQIKFSGKTYEIRSSGPDKQMGNDDDLTN